MKNELIIWALGFKRMVIVPEDWNKLPPLLQLEPEVKELETLVLEPYEAKGWENWGNFFLDNLLGTSEFRDDCKLENSNVVRFRNKKRLQQLTATAREPLLITNKRLGYLLKYDLEGFEYNFKNRMCLFSGYAFFTPLKARNARQQRLWAERRQAAYLGSSMHFMRSLFRNRLQQDGFSVYKMTKVWKRKVRYQMSGPPTMANITSAFASDEIEDSIYTPALPGDSIAFAHDSVTAVLSFPDYLVVTYPAKEPARYAQQQMRPAQPLRQSQLWLQPGREIFVQANGNYANANDLLLLGFWSWQDKLSSMLPIDYKPPVNLAK
jgi:hypothetical protein